MSTLRSLAVPRNPLERLKEMEAEMDAASPAAAADEPSSPGTPTTDDARTHPRTSEPTHERTHAPPRARAGVRGHARTGGAGGEAARRAALAQLLGTPVEGDPARGPLQPATVRMPVAVWEQVGWVAAFQGRAKQEVIAEALVAYLERVRKETRG
ncbi:MAG: hypothetical protein ACJ8F7_22005 [Gemmataceae bacterium]